MDEMTMQFDTEKFMKSYAALSSNRLEGDVARSYAAQVKRDVQEAQDRADQIVNALTSRSKPPDFAAARSALGILARGPSVVVAHWQPFIALVAEVLPPREEGEVDAPAVETAAESAELKDLRALFGKIGAVLPVASARDLRELRAGFAMLGDAIGAEFGKRGMAFERDGSKAVLDRLSEELDIASKPEPLPKTFAFSDQRVMEMRGHLDAQREQLIAADAKIAELKEDAAAGAAGDDENLKKISELTAEVESTIKTRDEMGRAADAALVKLEVQEKLLAEGADQLVKQTEATQSVRKQLGEVEHEFEEFKKHHKKPKCG